MCTVQYYTVYRVPYESAGENRRVGGRPAVFESPQQRTPACHFLIE